MLQRVFCGVLSVTSFYSMAQPTISIEDLRQNPTTFNRVFDYALQKSNVDLLRDLSSAYKELPSADKHKQLLAQGLIARDEQRFADAHQMFDELYQQTQSPVALAHKAITFAHDKQYQEASELLKNQATLQHLAKDLNKLQQVRWYAEFNYQSSDNVNQAPDERIWHTDEGYWQFSEKLSDHKLSYTLGVNKEFWLPKGAYIRPSVLIDGIHHKKLKQYNEIKTQLQFPLGKRKAKYDISISPILTKRWYDDQSYAQSFGIRPEFRYQLDKKNAIGISAELAWNKFDHTPFRNSRSGYVGLTYSRQHKGLRQYLASSYYWNSQTRDDDDKIRQIALSYGINKQVNQWTLGTQISGFVSKNQGEDFLGIKRRDKGYQFGISVSNRRYSLMGFYPKLTWQISKSWGNHPLSRRTYSGFTFSLLGD